MFIGVNDVGEITGIPCINKLSPQRVKKYIKDALRLIKTDDEYNASKIKVKIHKLEKNID